MMLLFGLFAMIIGWLQSKHRSDDFKLILREQSIHWVTSFLVVGGAFLIHQSGRIAEEDAGLIILLILSLSTILDGLRVGWRFSLVGLFLGVAAVVSVYTRALSLGGVGHRRFYRAVDNPVGVLAGEKSSSMTDTDRYAVFGHPIKHSKSPRIHGLFAEQTGQSINTHAVDVPAEQFSDAVTNFSPKAAKA